MKKNRSSIYNRILASYLLLVLVSSIGAGLNLYWSIGKTNASKANAEVRAPSIQKLGQLAELAVRSQVLTLEHVYSPTKSGTLQLKKIHEKEYPILRDDVRALSLEWGHEEWSEKLGDAFVKVESIFRKEKTILSDLSHKEDYQDSTLMAGAFAELLKIRKNVWPFEKELLDLEDKLRNEMVEVEAKALALNEDIWTVNSVMALVVLLGGLLVAWLLARSISLPLENISKKLKKLAKGDVSQRKSDKKKAVSVKMKEIVGIEEATVALSENLRKTSEFAENIGKGKYGSNFQPVSKNDLLGNALLGMRDNLRKVSEDDQARNWVTEGTAKFADILRNNNDNLANLADEILKNLVRYVGANQGGLFILGNENEEDPFMELAACYAWDRKKFLEQKVRKGEGLIGQAWLERSTLYLTDIPEEYVSITSGLGKANPSCLVIVPLQINEKVYGVLEIASFKLLKEHEIQFLEKISENIASAVSSVKIAENTQRLLEESTELTEQMRAQEEEMRQNMEELQATQEEVSRQDSEGHERLRLLDESCILLTLDKNLCLANANENAVKALGPLSGMLGKQISSLLVDPISGESLDNLQEGDTYGGVWRMRGERNDIRLVKVSVRAHTDLNEFSRVLTVIGVDVTDVTVEA
ncbi:hypothetical protein FUAX_36430 [Fulvitalea axinellae]|uniref:GAF domain-containing protein n=1 Tax=Fulvitalea axinellae TaxID=1182444 RepID=A0AAU9CGD0_9BACT|nr:hypothetical protein FUAX_36430 [Fulvitalea axinellae]